MNLKTQRTMILAGLVILQAILGTGHAADSDDTREAEFFVAPDGDDSWSGRRSEPHVDRSDGPFATLERARDAVRQLARREGNIKVLIRGGEYRFRKTVVFSLKDSAGDQHSVTYAAFPGETPVFSGGRSVGPWRKPTQPPEQLPPSARDKVWVADVAKDAKFFMLYDADGALPRARGRGFSPTNVTPRGTRDHQTVQFPAGSVGNYANLNDVELRIIPSHYWIMNLLPIASIDPATRTLVTGVPGTYPLGRNGMTDQDNAWIENALELLDEPGEWVLDSTQGRLYHWPRAGQPGDQILIPTQTELIRVEGQIDYEGPKDQPVKGLIFQGLTFKHGDRYPWYGRTGWGLQHDWELFDKPTALVRFRGARECAVEQCEFTDSGHTAIRLDLYCQNNRIVGNHIHNIGGVGVLLAGYGPGTKDVNRQNEITNNYIHHIGQQYWGSGGIFAWQSGGNRIAHNHISHVPYTAILATGRISRTPPGPGECSRTVRWHETPVEFREWDWARREPYLHARRNLIEANNIHDAMERLGDGNGIYVSGAGGGNVVRFNYCHHCYGPYMNAVIRCDDDQHETRMEGNICLQTGGFGEGLISKGNNDILNNVVADLRPVQRHRGYIVFPYGDIRGTRIEGNILYSRRKGQVLFHHSQPSGRHGTPPRLQDAQMGRNLYFCTEDATWADEHLKTQQNQGNEEGSVQADPRFADLEGGDFRFHGSSAAAAMGIQPQDAMRAGLEPAYRKRFLGRMLHTRITPSDRVLRRPQTVTISSSESDAVIRYTLDGSEPTITSLLYRIPFALTEPAIVRAKAFVPGATDAVGARACFAPPPAPILEDFENLKVGDVTAGATTSEDSKLEQYTARVSDEYAAEGRHSLKFFDGPGQEKSFTPHVYFQPLYTEAHWVGRFDVRLAPESSMYYQWRHHESGYRCGPTVTVLPGGQVVHNGRRLASIAVHQWVRFEVSCRLGDPSTRTFQLRIWLPGERSPRVFDALALDEGFERLDWVGFVSKSDEESAFYVDNVEVRPGGDKVTR